MRVDREKYQQLSEFVEYKRVNKFSRICIVSRVTITRAYLGLKFSMVSSKLKLKA